MGDGGEPNLRYLWRDGEVTRCGSSCGNGLFALKRDGAEMWDCVDACPSGLWYTDSAASPAIARCLERGSGESDAAVC